MFVTSLDSCMWSENYPHHSYTDALRWDGKFEYKMNYLLINNKKITGWEYDIATSTVNFLVGENYTKPFRVRLRQAVTDLECLDGVTQVSVIKNQANYQLKYLNISYQMPS